MLNIEDIGNDQIIEPSFSFPVAMQMYLHKGLALCYLEQMKHDLAKKLVIDVSRKNYHTREEKVWKKIVI